jgi:phosphoribosylformimino-5-aminoimidazole carboxamide ribotide isomerase
MLLVIPSIDLKSGTCKDCICSTLPMIQHYSGLSEHPEQLSRLFRRENAKSLHINDIDSLEKRSNQNNIDTILKINKSVEIPIQCYAGYQNIDECKFLLDNGIHRVIIDELFVSDKENIKELISEYTPSRVAFYAEIDLQTNDNNCINVDLNFDEYIARIKHIGGDRLILKENSIQENIEESIEKLNEIASTNKFKITLHDAACSYNDLNYINDKSSFFIDSIVLGKALYNNKFPCQEIWRLAESRLENQIKHY